MKPYFHLWTARFAPKQLALLRAFALVGCSLLLTGFSLAQQAPSKNEEEEEAPRRTNELEKTPIPPGNPIILKSTQDGSGNRPQDYNIKGERLSGNRLPRTDNGDFRRRPADPRLTTRNHKALTYYGYTLFEPARQMLIARRNLALQQLSPDKPLITPDAQTKPESGVTPSDKEKNKENGAIVERDPDKEQKLLQLPRKRASERTTTTEGENGAEGEANARETPLQEQDAARNGNGTNSRSRRRSSPSDEDSFDPQRDELEKRLRALEQRAPSPANAFNEIADPWEQLKRNILATAPASYQLWGGDRLRVTFRSPTMTEQELVVTVDALGNVELGAHGRVNVRGMTLEQAEKAVELRLARLYRNVRASVELKELRTIAVTIYGEAFAPGTYNVPAIATAWNVLYTAGGPTENGTLRKIEVRRKGIVVATMDVYKFLQGEDQTDIPLQAGDMIAIPAAYSRITVSGEVRQPAIYETLEGESLGKLLRYAGGVKPTGVSQNIQVTTLAPGQVRQIQTVDLTKPEAQKHPVYDGDLVEVFSLRPVIANRVTVEGAVDLPGDYALTPGMKVYDLVLRARDLLPEAYLEQADLLRWNPDNTTTLIPIHLGKARAGSAEANIALQPWDKLTVYTRNEVAWTGYRKVEIRGAVRAEGVYALSKNMRVSDLLRRAGGLTPDAYREQAYVMRQRGDGSFGMVKFNLVGLMNAVPGQDPELEDNDIVSIYRVTEANFTPDRSVTLVGEVTAPGVYPRFDGMRLNDLIELSGGLKPGAGGSILVAHARRRLDNKNETANSVRVALDLRGKCAPEDNVALEDGDVILVQADGGFQYTVPLVYIRGAVNRPGPVALNKKEVRLSEAIKEAGGLRPEAFAEGAIFQRNPSSLTTPTQTELAQRISEMTNLLNQSEARRLSAAADIQRIKAIGQATQSATATPIPTAGGVAQPNAAVVDAAQKARNMELVTPPRALKDADLQPNGHISINLEAALRNPGGPDDIILKEGDMITVPETPTTIQIYGAVINPRAVLYKKGERLDFYINATGGFAIDAAKDKIVVIRAGGGLAPIQKAGAIRPGDSIFVPTKVLAGKISTSNPTENIFRQLSNSVLSGFFLFRLFGL
jgi:protein involved in polysaccharide export with SLBB domain